MPRKYMMHLFSDAPTDELEGFGAEPADEVSVNPWPIQTCCTNAITNAIANACTCNHMACTVVFPG